MDPREAAAQLRLIAAKIDNSKEPARKLVAVEIRRILAALEGEKEKMPEGWKPKQDFYPNLGRDDLISELLGRMQKTGMPQEALDDIRKVYEKYPDEQIAKTLKKMGGPIDVSGK